MPYTPTPKKPKEDTKYAYIHIVTNTIIQKVEYDNLHIKDSLYLFYLNGDIVASIPTKYMIIFDNSYANTNT
jgi:hypothetical protein